eukprot:TRINITY_DN60856_c0_g1_i2.p1 TRINITY_DN60856_c0_g1~~TRINITY_DN60856_c0_g1_i2.p1  ORF type:complete len:363 (-),score=59.14 TRINITY_DN60856_c0_g1_i2:131-1219(-)
MMLSLSAIMQRPQLSSSSSAGIGYVSFWDIWKFFDTLFMRLNDATKYKPLWMKLTRNMIKELKDQGVQRAEVIMACRASSSFGDGGSGGDAVVALYDEYQQYSIDDKVALFQSLSTEVQQQSGGIFFGVGVVLATHKANTPQQVQQCVEQAWHLKQKFPDTMTGFDLFGQEDEQQSIGTFAEQLLWLRNTAHSGGVDMALLLHAGETFRWNSTTLIDAVALGASRLGHAFDIINHPALMQYIRTSGISLDLCPISNQVLFLEDNIANHIGRVLLRHNISFGISPDDPALWGIGYGSGDASAGVVFDWTVATVGWGLGLNCLKHIAAEGLKASIFPNATLKEQALEVFDNSWKLWVDEHAPPT